MALVVTKKRFLCRATEQYGFYSHKLPSAAMPQHGLQLLLKECQDCRGLRDSQLTRILLDNHGLDGVVVCDNDKALCGNTPKEVELRDRKPIINRAREMYCIPWRVVPQGRGWRPGQGQAPKQRALDRRR